MVVLLAVFVAWPAHSQPSSPVEPAEVVVTVTCAGDEETRTSQHSIVAFFCSKIVSDGVTSGAVAEGYLDTPLVYAESVSVGATTSIAVSTITGQVRVNQTDTPPATTTVLDLGWFKTGEVAPTGSAFGTVRASIDGPNHADTTLALAPPNFDNQKFSIDVVPDAAYTVTLRASCQSALDGHCVASLDPEVFLDQAAFDLRMGASTYPLEDYFEVEVSANFVATPVPLLSMPALLLVVVALLFAGVATARGMRSRSART